MTEHRVSSRYAHALLDTAEQGKMTPTIMEDFNNIAQMLSESRDLCNLIESPVIQHWKKKNAMEEIFKGRVSDLMLNFLLLITEKGRERLLFVIMEQFEIQYNRKYNKVPVEIYSAVELEESLREDIVKKLEAKTKKEVLPRFFVDKSLKGGLKLKIEDWVFDSSVRTQLESLYEKLAKGQIVA